MGHVLLSHIFYVGDHPSRGCNWRPGCFGTRAGAAVQRAIPRLFPPRLLGAKVEHHGHQHSAPLRIRASPRGGDTCRGTQVGPASGRDGDFSSVSHHARAYILLPGARESDVGDYVLLSAPRDVFGG